MPLIISGTVLITSPAGDVRSSLNWDVDTGTYRVLAWILLNLHVANS
jgi:hypothetical protein